MRYVWAVWLANILAISLAGCGAPWLFGDDAAARILGVEGTRVFLEAVRYAEAYPESSLWVLDLETGDVQRVQEPVLQSWLQASGDYYVTEVLRDDYEHSDVVAGRISTGERVTICERDRSQSEVGYVDGHFVEGNRAVVGVENGVLIYDLATFSEVRRMELPETVRDMLAFRQGRIFAVGWEGSSDWEGWEELFLIDIDSGEVLRLPDAPRDGELYTPYHQVHLADEWLVMDQTVRLEESGEYGTFWGSLFDESVIRDEILGFHIPTQTWEVLTECEPYDPDNMWAFESYLLGGDATQAVVERVSYFPGVLRLEAIDLATRERSLLLERTGRILQVAYEHASPCLHTDQLYWIDGNTNMLVIYDPQTGREEHIATIDPVLE